MSYQYNSKLCKLFYAFYWLMHFDLFLQLNHFLFHLFYQSKVLDWCFLQAWFYIFWCFSILLIKPRIFNISIDSSSLNISSSSFSHLLQIIERINIFSKRYNVLVFQIFYTYRKQCNAIFFIFLVIQNILILFYHSFYNH